MGRMTVMVSQTVQMPPGRFRSCRRRMPTALSGIISRAQSMPTIMGEVNHTARAPRTRKNSRNQMNSARQLRP